MSPSSYITALALLLASSSALPASNPPQPYVAPLHVPSDAELVPGRYVVRFRDNHSYEQHCANVGIDSVAAELALERGTILHNFPGYHAYMSDEHLERVRSDPNVTYIEQDAFYSSTHPDMVEIPGEEDIYLSHEHSSEHEKRWNAFSQPNAPWHLAAISTNKFGDTQGSYDHMDDHGKGVNIYILDTGIRISHSDFGGRAVNFKGRTTTPYVMTSDGQQETCDDIAGHGTMVAGLAGSNTWGVAKAAQLVNVKVMGTKSANGAGLAEAVDEIISEHGLYKRNGDSNFKGSIINFSLGLYSSSQVLQDSLRGAINKGIHVVTAAGNDNADVTAKPVYPCNWSGMGFTCVGAIGESMKKAKLSNYGTFVTMNAPGENVYSTSKTNDTAIRKYSGNTSAASPIVAGIMAGWVGFEKLNQNGGSTLTGINRLNNNCFAGKLGSDIFGSVNYFANTGFNSGTRPYKGAPKDEL